MVSNRLISFKKNTMKTIIAICMLLVAVAAHSQNTSLTVVVKNVKDDSGKIAVALFGNSKDFMKKRLDGRITDARPGEVQVVFENVPVGEYAISVMHDANQNEELDSNMFGIPKEGFGFSNNAMGTFGPPSFEKAKFKCGESNEISISMRYM
jgi:uncharacterized protein (DUF2141 family)